MTKLIYWAATLPLCLMYLAAAGFYLTQGESVAEGFIAFGFPAYLVQVLIVAKIAAPLAILSRCPSGSATSPMRGFSITCFSRSPPT